MRDYRFMVFILVKSGMVIFSWEARFFRRFFFCVTCRFRVFRLKLCLGNLVFRYWMLEVLQVSIVFLGFLSFIIVLDVVISFFILRVLSKMFLWGFICKGEELNKIIKIISFYCVYFTRYQDIQFRQYLLQWLRERVLWLYYLILNCGFVIISLYEFQIFYLLNGIVIMIVVVM